MDDGVDGVAQAVGVGEAFEEEHADAFGPGGAVGGGGECFAAAVGGQAVLTAELHEGRGIDHDGGPSRQGQGAFAPAQCGGGQVDGDQGGGTGRVHGHGRTHESQYVGDAAGQHARQPAGDGERFLLVGPVLGVHEAAVGARQGVTQRGGVDAGVLDGLPAGFENQTLLGIHPDGFAGADSEEGGVELGGVVEESALACAGGAGVFGVGVEEMVEIPAAVARERADGVDTVGD
ncbi:hypothetical protein OG302_42415 [Streptomyces sp. NBC_01283]|nr:hypothetical protein OG302_42415 [Streptomyces sp. NBC_01283]